MKYCVFYVKNEHALSDNVVKEIIKTTPMLTEHLSENPDVDLDSLEVQSISDNKDVVVTVDVRRNGMKWEPIVCRQVILGRYKGGGVDCIM
jgi:hypothetical protein